MKPTKKCDYTVVWGYLGLYTLVNVIALIFVCLLLTRRVRINGYKRALKAVWHGNVVIASNHPSALETFVIPVLFWPVLLIRPRLFPWSITRFDAFPSYLQLLYAPFRCITVGHADAAKRKCHSIFRMAHVLGHHGVLIGYPEGTRTCKGKVYWRRGSKKMSVFDSSLPRLAWRYGSVIVPVWIDFGSIDTPLSMRSCLRRVLFVHPLIVSLGEAYAPNGAGDEVEVAAALRDRLFDA